MQLDISLHHKRELYEKDLVLEEQVRKTDELRAIIDEARAKYDIRVGWFFVLFRYLVVGLNHAYIMT